MPTLSLCVIAKNEESNLANFSSSIQGLFDEVIFVDTGSTDLTRNRAEALGYKVFDFDWINDFSAARNFSFSKATCDYIMWLDLDDIITPEARDHFLEWKKYMMGTCDFWLAPYHYATNSEGKVVCEFLRDRVIKRGAPIEWKYFLHEGLMAKVGAPPLRTQIVRSWHVTHNRTEEDLKKDKGRNLTILKANKDKLNSRMKYYYGKELFDAGKHVEAISFLEAAIADELLENHDRILAMQYLGYCYIRAQSFEQALGISTTALVLASHRAEFHCLAGDALVNLKRFKEAIPFYFAAMSCDPDTYARMNGAIFLTEQCYHEHPLSQIVKIYHHMGRHEKALELAQALLQKHPQSASAQQIYAEAMKFKSGNVVVSSDLIKTTDIVFTAPLLTPQRWDEEALKSGFLGGSETACVQMARQFKLKFPDRRVLVFNDRPEFKVCESGVEYIPIQEIPLYFQKFEPAVNICWRHTTRLTQAPSYVWCHDLASPGLDNLGAYDKVMVLSKFHKNYLQTLLGIPDEKIYVTANGLDPELFKEVDNKKDINKIVYSSSPDRGLLEVLNILDRVVETRPDTRLHVFYGLENLEDLALKTNNQNLKALGEQIRREIASRPYVVYHGGVRKEDLIRELRDASVWLYPTNFLETFCITSLEMLACGVIPVARSYGALPDTLEKELSKGVFELYDFDPLEVDNWVKATIKALDQAKEGVRVQIDPHEYSWEKICERWTQDLLVSVDLEKDEGKITGA